MTLFLIWARISGSCIVQKKVFYRDKSTYKFKKRLIKIYMRRYREIKLSNYIYFSLAGTI